MCGVKVFEKHGEKERERERERGGREKWVHVYLYSYQAFLIHVLQIKSVTNMQLLLSNTNCRRDK